MDTSLNSLILKSIVETSNNNITVTDAAGNILYSNPEHWTVYGVEPNYFVGKSVYNLQEIGILNPSIVALVIEQKKEISLMQQTITGKSIMTTAYPVFDDNNEIIFVVCYATDQTEILQLQEQYEKLEKKIESFQTEVDTLRQKTNIIYRSKSIHHVVKTIHHVANSDATVLLLGESGVGKSMFAHELHKNSNRKKEPFIEVNCSTIPVNLFESEMFGYESGSFTGADRKGKRGLIQQAQNGTLFLDEIGEIPITMQVKMLKVLQEKKIKPIGSQKEIQVDFRLVAATNQDLEQMITEGKFRLDLYYRLNVLPINIPALRERKEDITVLIDYYLQCMNKKYNTLKKLHITTYESLLQYSWPGNVRELENLIERLVLTSEENIIYPNSLPTTMSSHLSFTQDTSETSVFEDYTLKSALEQTEKMLLHKVQKKSKTTYEMAKLLGISQPSVIRKLKKYNDTIDI
ncbi:MAG TPA: sigma 54-interacting transcriptional regulator [Ureibacillus sp.]|nr:sigma 54-interacting transcriptional regulator [Ureibacillus sp.]